MPRVIDRDRGWKAIKARMRRSPLAVAVGFVGPDVTQPHGDAGDDATIVEIATIHEFGAPQAGIPERAPIRTTMDLHHRSYRKALRVLAAKVAAGEISMVQGLKLLGLRIEADMHRAIQRGLPPPLKPRTIERKGSSKPLIDKGQLDNSIGSDVRRVSP